jgi:hypothetical protein
MNEKDDARGAGGDGISVSASSIPSDSAMPPPTAEPKAPPGWYAEPGTGRQRYWHGQFWGQYAAPPPPPFPGPAEQSPSDGQGIQTAGYIAAGLSVLMPILGLAGLILGIITATKRGRGGHGAAIIIVSIALSTVSAIYWYDHYLTKTTQSLYQTQE